MLQRAKEYYCCRMEIAWHGHFLPAGLHAVERVCWAITTALCVTDEDAEVSRDSSAKPASIALAAAGIPNQTPLVATPPLPQKVRVAGRISRGGAGGPVQALLTHGSVNAAAGLLLLLPGS